MSDPMSQQMPGQAPGGMAKASMFNPADASMMAASGQFSQNMTVRDVLGKMGVDVDGPATQLVDLFKSQMQNRTLTGKLGIGGAPQGGPPGMMPQGQRPMGPPPQAPGLESGGMAGLMSKLKA